MLLLLRLCPCLLPAADYSADLERWQEAYNLVTRTSSWGGDPISSLSDPLRTSATPRKTISTGHGHPARPEGGCSGGEEAAYFNCPTQDSPMAEWASVAGAAGGGAQQLPGPAVGTFCCFNLYLQSTALA